MSGTVPALDPLLHQPSRTQLMAFLSGRGEASFAELKRVLGVTDGNLGAHLAKLVDAGYVRASSHGAGRAAQTVYMLTARGRGAFATYVRHLSALVKLSEGTEPGAAPDEPGLAQR